MSDEQTKLDSEIISRKLAWMVKNIGLAMSKVIDADKDARAARALDLGYRDRDLLSAATYLATALTNLQLAIPHALKAHGRLSANLYEAWCGHEFKRGENPTCACGSYP